MVTNNNDQKVTKHIQNYVHYGANVLEFVLIKTCFQEPLSTYEVG